MRLLITNLLASALLIFGAASAHAFATTMTSNYSNGTVLTTGDTVSVTVNFDSEGVAGISLLSVSVLFNDNIMSWDQGSSSSPSYALYVSGGKGNQYLVPATTNLTLRTGTSDQILLDWQNTALPGGNRDQCGNYGNAEVPEAPAGDACGYRMAILNFTANNNGLANFDLCNDCPGNILQLQDGSNPDNNLAGSGSVSIQIPEPTAASLSIFALLSMAGLRMRANRS